jgi:pimeloyl-ACP methyl ester carboxylesterase
MSTAPRNIVLVHGGFVDGSGWQGVYDLLTNNGHKVSIVQNPTLSLEGDADATRWVLDDQDGPVVLVGHSYGGAVITKAGTHDKVATLVYIAAFAPDKGESVNTLIADPPPGAPVPPILPPKDGFLLLDREKFHGSFAADLPTNQAAFMADSQVPWGVDALGGSITDAAWRTKPSWYLVATEDRMTPPRRPSASCPSGPAPPWSRWPAATLSTCRNRRRWPRSSNKPHPRSPGVANAVGACPSPWAVRRSGRPRVTKRVRTADVPARMAATADALRSAPVITSDQSWQT